MGEENLNPRDAYRVMLRDYPDVLNIDQMCEILSVSTKTGYAILKKGSVQHLKVGRTYRIPKLSVIEFLLTGQSAFPAGNPPLDVVCCGCSNGQHAC